MWIIIAAISLVALPPSSASESVLIWGSENLKIPSLKVFNNEDFDLLKSYLRGPEVLVFRGNPLQISDNLQDLLKNKYTAYVPNSNLEFEEVIDLDGDVEKNFATIRDIVAAKDGGNVLALIISNDEARRSKRDAEDMLDASTELPDIEVTEEAVYDEVSGPVLYKAHGKTKSYAMLYASQTPVLKFNNTVVNLGKATSETLDEREKYKILSVTLLVGEGGKAILKFKFCWNGGYWNMTTVGLQIFENSVTLSLASHADLGASRNFSYHCSENTVFRDAENRIELKLYDLQAQPDAKKIRFDAAYDCVNFTSVPIWSGLFVTYILLIGLAIGLNALNSIKTMDKFDNSKTKQLTITTSD